MIRVGLGAADKKKKIKAIRRSIDADRAADRAVNSRARHTADPD